LSGICGILRLDGGPVTAPEIRAMIGPLKRRGPDGANVWLGDGVALGHALLATTREAAAEQLPLAHENSQCVITADARIDNRDELAAELGLNLSERMIGDGELILLAYLKWGENCVKHFLGDFAFAIWDGRTRRLFCARDQVGMRQLIYCHLPGNLFLLATEPRAVIAHASAPREINEGRIIDYLENLGGFDLVETFYKGVFRLPPAHLLVVDQQRLSVRQYWFLQPENELKLGSDEAYSEAFLDVFQQAVRSRLRSSGPVGAMLSGGIDSGSVAAVAARQLAATHKGPLQTFSGVGPDPSSCIETRTIRAALTISGIEPELVSLASLDGYIEELAQLTRCIDEPTDGQMTLLRVVYLAANRSGIKVVLDGVGGDTVLSAGNHVARLLRRGWVTEAIREARGEQSFWGHQHPAHRAFALGAWRAFVPKGIRHVRQNAIAAIRDRIDHGAHISAGLFSNARERKRRWRQHLTPFDSTARDERALLIRHPYLTIGREAYDRVASALAIEPRDPFVDLRLVRFSLALPPEQLQSRGWPKLILRKATAGLLPEEVRWRPGKEHLGWSFTRALFASRCWSEKLDGHPRETISRFVALDQIESVQRKCGDSKAFVDWVNAVYLSLWFDSVNGGRI